MRADRFDSLVAFASVSSRRYCGKLNLVTG